MRPRKTARKVVPPPPDVEALIKRLEAASKDDIVDILRPLQIWCFPRGDLHSWVNVIKKFNTMLSEMRDSYGLGSGSKTPCKVQLNEFTPKDKDVLLEVLRFIRLLMENSTSRKLYDGYDVVNDLLLTNDLDVLEAALYVLLRPLQQYTTQMPTSPELGNSIRARLLALTRGWDRFHMADCSLVKYASSPEAIELPDAAARLQIQFYPPMDPMQLVEPQPPKPTPAVAVSQETPTKATATGGTARSDATRPPVTPAPSRGATLPVDSNMVTVDMGNVAKTMTTNNYLDRFAQVTEEHRMEVEDQLLAVNKLRLIVMTQDLETRRKLLSNRLLALTCYTMFSEEEAVQSNIFLCEPELVNEVSDLLVPERDVSETVVASSILALDAAAHHRAEVLTSINAHVSHGTIMSLLRSVVAKLVNGKPVAHDTVDAMLGFLAYINSLPLHGNLLIGAGLIPALLEMLDAKGERRGQYIPRAAGLIDSSYFTHPQALQAFNNADGLNALVSRIKAEVGTITDAPLPEATPLFNQDTLVAYNTNPLKAELRSMYRMLQSTGGSDGFRNVVDTDLPKSLKRIITNADKFGLRNFGLAINVMSVIVHNEPTSLGILQEVQLPQTLYQVLEDKMPDAFEVVYTLPNAIGAICLNEQGLDATINHFSVISNIIKVVTSWNTDDSERDYIVTISNGLDELVRHHPQLRPKVREALMALLREAIDEGRAFKPQAKNINDYAVDPNDCVPDSTMDVDTKDGDSDKPKEMITNAPLAKITNILKMLGGLLRNSNMCKEFLAEGGLDTVLSIAELPCVPVRLSSTDLVVAMPGVMRVIGEYDQVQLTERLVTIVQNSLNDIPEIWQKGADSHEAWVEMTKTDGTPADYQRLRRVASLSLLLSALSDFLSISLGNYRTAAQLIKALGVSSGSNFMTDLGLLHRQCLIEHVLFKDIGAADAAEYAAKQSAKGKEKEGTKSVESAETSAEGKKDEASAETTAEGETEPSSDVVVDATGVVSPTPGASSPTAESGPAAPSTQTAIDKRPPTRVQTVKTLATRMHATLTRFFRAAIRLVFNKRVPDSAHKAVAPALADCIAEIIIGHLNASAQVPSKAYAIDTVTLGLTTIYLFDERGAEGHIATTLFIPFDQKGGMNVLLDNVRRLVHGMGKYPDVPADKQTQQQKEEAAQFTQGIRIATSVLSAFASPRSLVDSPQTHIIQQREASLPPNKRFSSTNTFIRIRRDIFPVARQIWMAEWLPDLQLPIVRTAISTFFEIMAGKHEEMETTIAMPEPPSPLLRDTFQPRPPPPTANPAAVAQLVEMGFPQHAAERALVRARNNVAGAADMLISMPHLFPDTQPATPAPNASGADTPAVENADADADAGAQAEASASAPNGGDAQPSPSAAPTTSDAAATKGDDTEADMDVDEPVPSPTAIWEGQRDELNKLREEAKPEIPARAIQLLDMNVELVHDLLPAFPDGVDGVSTIVDRLEAAVKEDPRREKALTSMLRLVSVFARSKGPIDLPVDQSKRAMDVLMSLDAGTTPRPPWLSAYLLAGESILLMSYSVTEAKLGDEAQANVLHTVDFGDAPARLLALCQMTLGLEDVTREELMGAMRLTVVLTRRDAALVSPELLKLALANFKNPNSKVAGSYPYLAMLVRHAFDEKSALCDVMRREISEWMTPTRNKVSDVTHFVRQLRQMAYRDSNTFLDAVQEEGALVDPGPSTSVYHIRAKNDGTEDDGSAKDNNNKDETADGNGKKATTPAATQSQDPFVKTTVDTFDHKPVMDYLVSELGTTMRGINTEELGVRRGEPYSDSASQSYAYAGLLMSIVTELTGSYMTAKKAFMAAVCRGSVYSSAKGKSGFAAVLSDLVCCVTLADVQERSSGGRDAPELRRVTLSSWATSLLVALCANVAVASDSKELPDDLVSVRKVVLDGIAKALKDSTSAHYDPNTRYGRLWALGQLIRRLLTGRPSVIPRPADTTSVQLAKGMLEKNFVGLMTSTVSEIDLNYPDIRNVLVSLLKALEHLTKISNKWGKKDYKPAEDGDGESHDSDSDSSDDDDDDSDMSMSDEDDAPDLYRNSALGILGGDIDVDDEDDDMDGSDMDEDDELMEAFEDEMDDDMDEDDADTDPSDDDDDDDSDDDDEGSEMEGDWTTDEEGEEGDDADAPVIEMGAEVDEEDDEDAGVPWEEDDGMMDPEEGEEFDMDDDGFIHESFGGIDFDPEEEAMAEEMFEDDGYAGLPDPLAPAHVSGGPTLGDGGGHWGWQEPRRSDSSRQRNRLTDMDTAASSLFGFPSRNTGADTTQHPFLATERPQSAAPPNTALGALSSLNELLSNIESLGGPEAVQFLENIVQQNLNHGADRLRVDLAQRHDGSFDLSIGGRSFTVQPSNRPLPNTVDEIQGEFEPRPTLQRWQEEQQLFPYHSSEQIARLVIHLINRLLPAARETAAREAERLRKQEAEEAEQRKKEEEEAAVEAAKKREEEVTEAAAVELPESRPETSQGAVDDDVDMASIQDVEIESLPDEEEAAPAEPAAESNRVTINLHGEEIDITDTGIDLEFLEALPEDMRAEVVEHHLREQSLLMRPAAAEVPDSSHIHDDFLQVLPPEIRAEVMMQESLEQARRNAPPAETRPSEPQTATNRTTAGTFRDLEVEMRGVLRGDDLRDMLARTIGIPPSMSRKAAPKKKPSVVIEKRPLQLLDKPGIASLVRLLFFPAALREGFLFRTLVNLCENTETRSDLLNLLLSIVQDGTGDLPAVDRSFQQMSLRGLTSTPKAQATPSGKVVETPGPITASLFSHLQSDHIPTFIAQRCFEALSYIVNANRYAVSYFLTEHELPVGLKKQSKKGKAKEKFLPQKQYPIVVLMSLLDRTELLRAPGMMESLTGLLAAVTKPLVALHSWQQRQIEGGDEDDKDKKEDKDEADKPAAAGAAAGQVATTSSTEDAVAKSDPSKWKVERPMFPPAVLRLVVNGLTVGDCTSRTFTQTIMVLQNLSSIPSAKKVLVHELCTRAQSLGGVIVNDLKKLTGVLSQEDHTVSSVDLVDFAPASSPQAQLLRLLKTIEYLHSRKGSNVTPPKSEDLTEDEKAARDIYLSFDFSQLWTELSDCLTLAESRGSTDQIAAVLLPLVEALMVVCKYTRPPGAPAIGDALSPVLSPSTPSVPKDLFLTFTTTHRKVLNSIVRNNPALMSGSFSLLVANPRVLEFDNKRNWFFQKLKRKRDQLSYPTLHLNVRRQYVFQDSFSALLHRPGDEVKYGKINVKFINEDGVDAGGVTREWYHVLAQQIFDPNYALFEPCAADAQTYQPNKHSSVNPDHLSYFKFVGRLIGKAIFDGRLLDAYFNRAFYKQILGRSIDVRDLEAIDPEYHKSLQWMLDNDITDVIDQEFTIEDETFGAKQVVELKPGGAQIPVTEENKEEYVRLVCAYRLESSIKEQMNAFLSGFYEMIPRQLIQIFEPDQLELLISGMSTFDVDELKNSTQMSGWKPNDVEISWFWRALRSFSQEERSRFLIFVTASSRVPLGGFEKLQGASGIQPFQIQRLFGKEGILPQASTCFNQLLLPKYESYEQLRERLLFAVTETQGFGKA